MHSPTSSSAQTVMESVREIWNANKQRKEALNTLNERMGQLESTENGWCKRERQYCPLYGAETDRAKHNYFGEGVKDEEQGDGEASVRIK